MAGKNGGSTTRQHAIYIVSGSDANTSTKNESAAGRHSTSGKHGRLSPWVLGLPDADLTATRFRHSSCYSELILTGRRRSLASFPTRHGVLPREKPAEKFRQFARLLSGLNPGSRLTISRLPCSRLIRAVTRFTHHGCHHLRDRHFREPLLHGVLCFAKEDFQRLLHN